MIETNKDGGRDMRDFWDRVFVATVQGVLSNPDKDYNRPDLLEYAASCASDAVRVRSRAEVSGSGPEAVEVVEQIRGDYPNCQSPPYRPETTQD